MPRLHQSTSNFWVYIVSTQAKVNTALYEVVRIIEKYISTRQYTLAIFIDVEGRKHHGIDLICCIIWDQSHFTFMVEAYVKQTNVVWEYQNVGVGDLDKLTYPGAFCGERKDNLLRGWFCHPLFKQSSEGSITGNQFQRIKLKVKDSL